MLVNMVARMQKDIVTLCEENRLLRTPAISQVVQAPPAGGVHDNESATVIDRCLWRLCGRRLEQ